MVKKVYLYIISLLVLTTVVFNLVSFLVPFRMEINSGSFWIIYVFSLFYILTFFVFIFFYIREKGVEAKFLNSAFLIKAIVCFALQIVFFLIVLILGCFIKIEFYIPLILEFLLLLISVFLIGTQIFYLSHLKERKIEKENDLNFMKNFRNEVYFLTLEYKNSTISKNIESLNEVVHFADPISKPSRNNIELEITETFTKLKKELTYGKYQEAIEIINKIEILFKKRSVL